MQILSTVDAWSALAHIPDEDERVKAWTAEYEARWPTVFEVYYSGWGEPEQRRGAALAAPGLLDRIHVAERRAEEVLRAAEADFRDLGLLFDDDLHAVLMVGGGSSNGWVAEHEGRRVLFLALEMLGMPPHDDVLIVHELTHVVQGQLCEAARARTFTSSFAVFTEGAAVASTRRIRPGLSDSAYLWMDEDHHDWVSQCQYAAPGIAAMVLEHLDSPADADAVAPLLRNRSGEALPPRSGYWAGDQIAGQMLNHGYALTDVLSTPAGQARARVAQWATERAANR